MSLGTNKNTYIENYCLDLFSLVKSILTIYNLPNEETNTYINRVQIMLKNVLYWQRKQNIDEQYYEFEHMIPQTLLKKCEQIGLTQNNDEGIKSLDFTKLNTPLIARCCFVSSSEPLYSVDQKIREYIYCVLLDEIEKNHTQSLLFNSNLKEIVQTYETMIEKEKKKTKLQKK